MKKVIIAARREDASSTVETVRGMGLLHVDPVAPPQSPDARGLEMRVDVIQRAIQVLGREAGEEEQKPVISVMDTAREILADQDVKTSCEERLQEVGSVIDRLRPVGNFSPADLQELAKHGVTVKIYKCPRPGEVEIEVPYAKVGEDPHVAYIAAVSDRDVHLPFDEVGLPRTGLWELEQEAASLSKRIEELNHRIEGYRVYRGTLESALDQLTEHLEFQRVQDGMGSHGELIYLQGYCPAEQAARVRRKAEEQELAVLFRNPGKDDNVPVLLRNPPWIDIVAPVFRFMGTIPGYREFDISLWFLISLSIFFAMLVGDGGYGLLFLMGTLVAWKRVGRKDPEIAILLTVFSSATIIWGAVTGTWFGAAHFSQLPVLRGLVIEELSSFSPNEHFMIRLCFLLGAVHLSIAHGIRGVRWFPSPRWLRELGWVCILWFLYFLAGSLVLGETAPGGALYLLGAGVFLAVVFSGPSRGVMKSVLFGLADLPLGIIRSFSDLVSYIRLFAVGYATAVVAISFNELAAGLGGDGLIKSLAIPGVLLMGHGMNILLALMAVLVHGIRLNVLEFSSHLEMEWSGRPYRPFKRGAPGGEQTGRRGGSSND